MQIQVSFLDATELTIHLVLSIVPYLSVFPLFAQSLCQHVKLVAITGPQSRLINL